MQYALRGNVGGERFARARSLSRHRLAHLPRSHREGKAMNTFAIDTLEYANRLQEAGFEDEGPRR